MGIAMLVVVGTTLVMGYETQLALVILVVGLGNVFESISELFHGLLQQRERMDSIAIALMIRGPLNLVFLAVAVYLTGSILWGIVGFPLAWAVTLLACDIPNGARMVKGSTPQAGASSAARAGIGGLRPRWNPRSLVRLAWIGLPLGVVTMMVMLIENVPRYMIDYHLGKPALGVFASIIYLMMVGTMVVNGLGQSASPRLAKHYARGDRPAFCRLLGKLLGVALCLGGGGAMLMVLFGGRVLQLLYGAEFTRYADLAVYLMIAAAIMYLNGPLSKAVEAMRHFKMNMVVRTTSGLVLLVLLPGLLGTHGLKGVAGAIAISAAVSLLMYAGTAYWGIRRTEEATAQGVAAALT